MKSYITFNDPIFGMEYTIAIRTEDLPKSIRDTFDSDEPGDTEGYCVSNENRTAIVINLEPGEDVFYVCAHECFHAVEGWLRWMDTQGSECNEELRATYFTWLLKRVTDSVIKLHEHLTPQPKDETIKE